MSSGFGSIASRGSGLVASLDHKLVLRILLFPLEAFYNALPSHTILLAEFTILHISTSPSNV